MYTLQQETEPGDMDAYLKSAAYYQCGLGQSPYF